MQFVEVVMVRAKITDILMTKVKLFYFFLLLRNFLVNEIKTSSSCFLGRLRELVKTVETFAYRLAYSGFSRSP